MSCFWVDGGRRRVKMTIEYLENGVLQYTLDGGAGLQDKMERVVPAETLEECQALAAEAFSLSADPLMQSSLAQKMQKSLLPSGLGKMLQRYEKDLILRDSTGYGLPWQVLFPRASLALHGEPEVNRPRKKQRALLLLDPRSDILTPAVPDETNRERVRKMETLIQKLKQIFERAGIEVVSRYGASVTKEYLKAQASSFDILYYFGHAQEKGLVLAEGFLSATEILQDIRLASPLLFINGCRAAMAPKETMASKETMAPQDGRSSGLARAFGEAGELNCVIAPLHAVEAVAACEMAVCFFSQFLVEEKPLATCVEKARRKTGPQGAGYQLYANYPSLQYLPQTASKWMLAALLPGVLAIGVAVALVAGGVFGLALLSTLLCAVLVPVIYSFFEKRPVLFSLLVLVPVLAAIPAGAAFAVAAMVLCIVYPLILAAIAFYLKKERGV